VVLIGAQALGAFVWGLVASRFGLSASLTTAAVLLIAAAVSMVVLPLLPETGIEQPSPSEPEAV
jgi:MFS-type transporter involved in bile tolerance (Atg22 family)